MNILAPSLLAADFSSLREQILAVEEAGARYLHLDVMDGAFVPSISFGMPVIASLRGITGMAFDVHLMVERPERYLEDFAKSGADIITIHQESCIHLDRAIHAIKDLGRRAGIALNPATPAGTVEHLLGEVDMVLVMTVNPGFGGQRYIGYCTDKIRELRSMIAQRGLDTDIEVDGGITLSNVEGVLAAGANVIVAGSAVFGGSPGENVARFMEKLSR